MRIRIIKLAALGLMLALGPMAAQATPELIVTIENISSDPNNPIATFSVVSPFNQDFVNQVDFGVAVSDPDFAVPYLGSATGAVATIGGLGCDAGDFANFTPNRIALIERGTCFFSDKINNAMAAGALGVIIYNNLPIGEGGGPFNFVLIDDTFIPSIGISLEFGQAIAAFVPEPSTLALFALGLLGLGFARRRRV